MKVCIFLVLWACATQCMQGETPSSVPGESKSDMVMLLELRQLHDQIQSDPDGRAKHVSNFLQKLETFAYFYPEQHASCMDDQRVPGACRQVATSLVAHYRTLSDLVYKYFAAGSDISIDSGAQYLEIIYQHFPHLKHTKTKGHAKK